MKFEGERFVPSNHNQNDSFYLEHIQRYRFTKPYIQGKKILDLGCGTGYGSKELIKLGAGEVTGIDISREAIKFAISNFQTKSDARIHKLTFQVGDVTRLPFLNNSFDVIISFEVIEHIQNYLIYLQEAFRVLRDGGYFIFSTPNRLQYRHSTSHFHFKEFTTDELIDLFKQFKQKVVVYGQRFTNKKFIAAEKDFFIRYTKFTSGGNKTIKKLLPVIPIGLKTKVYRALWKSIPSIKPSDIVIAKENLGEALTLIGISQKKPVKTIDTVSIIAVNWSAKEKINDLLNSLKKLNYPKNKLEIIVVDNHSTDGSNRLIKKYHPKVRLIRLKDNIGYGPALNIGIKRASGNYMFISNNDLCFHPDSIKILVRYIQKHPEIGILGGKIISSTNQTKVASGYQKFNYLTSQIDIGSTAITRISKVQWVQGCAMLIPRSVFKEVGLFDENFSKIYFEDLDLCKRVQEAGYETVINPNSIIYHYQSYTMDNVVNLSTKWFYWHKNKIQYMIKYASLVQILTVIILQGLLSLYWTLIKNEPSLLPFLKAFSWNIRHFISIRHRHNFVAKL